MAEDNPDPKFEELLLGELDRIAAAGMALVSVAFVDETLKTLLLTAMRQMSNVVASRIFDSNGPLYEVAPKADIAYAFGLIDDATLATLRTLRDIRNRFAHTKTPLHFNSDEIAQLCKKLPGWNIEAQNLVLYKTVAIDCVHTIEAKTKSLALGQALRTEVPPS